MPAFRDFRQNGYFIIKKLADGGKRTIAWFKSWGDAIEYWRSLTKS